MPKDLSGAQVGVSPRASVNDPRPSPVGGRNEFPQTYKHLTTDRYGEFSPFYWAKAERGDVQNLHAVHDLHTFTMKSPMVSDVKMTKSFFKVPMQAIYPRNWDKMITIPTQGDDVPSDCRALFDFTKALNYCKEVFAQIHDDYYDANIVRRAFILFELLASDGSLFNRFNLHPSVLLYDRDSSKYFTPDEFMDAIYFRILDALKESDCYFVDDNNAVYKLKLSDSPVSSYNVKFVNERRFIELFRDTSFDLGGYWSNLFVGLIDYLPFDLTTINIAFSYNSTAYNSEPKNARFINIEPIIAYQLSCAQFGSNDFVDYIYSAQLYRDNLQSLYLQTEMSMPTFSYNGIQFQYDIFSENVFTTMANNLLNDPSCFDFFINLFSYQNSLRFGDYFTGAKPRPLAVGEYSAQVNAGQVSAIDITRSIQMQRLLNRVNMVGRKLGDYLSGIFGGSMPAAPKDVPIFLAHQKYDLKGFEVNNTGEVQFDIREPNTITSQIRSAENRHIFEIQIDEPCYLIGVNSYEMPRIYSLTMDRFAFHHDRYDDFIPQMQYIGDQDIMAAEIDSRYHTIVPFAYTLRYMEYKQRYSYASGGFIRNLPSWAFITDNEDGNSPSDVIDPNYIRSSPSEFDRFYKSLTGYSLGTYFHFIVAHTNITSPSRQMEYTPEILK